jgi:hypothetical protein
LRKYAEPDAVKVDHNETTRLVKEAGNDSKFSDKATALELLALSISSPKSTERIGV